MSILFFLPLLSLASFIFLARYFFKLSSASLGAGFVIWIAWTGLIGRALSLSNALDCRVFWVIGELLPLIAVIYISRKRTAGSWAKIRADVNSMYLSLRESSEKVWVTPALLVAVAVVYTVGLFANLMLPQNMDDSLTAYLARAGFWISNQSTEFFQTSNYNFPLVAYPALPTFSTLRWIVLTGGDHAASLDQWIATLISGTIVFSLARKAKATIEISLFVALVWLLMPVTLLQSQMVLYDAVALVAILTAVTAACDCITQFSRNNFLICMLAVFVAIGTKQTVIFMLPSAFIAIVVSCVASRKTLFIRAKLNSKSLRYCLIVVVIGLWIAVPEYLLNLKRFKHPLGPRESFGYFAVDSVGLIDRTQAIFTNSLRVLVAGLFGDVPPQVAEHLPGLFNFLRNSYSIAGTGASRAVGVGWYGSTVMLIVLFSLLTWVFLSVQRRFQLSLMLLVIGGVLYSFLFMYTRSNFSEAFSRYMWFPVTLFLIAGARGLDKLKSLKGKNRPKMLGQVVFGLLAAISIGQGSWSFLGNGVRPLIGEERVWSKSDGEIMYLAGGFGDSGAFVPMIEKIESCVDSTNPLGTYLPHKFPLSLLFGASYDRKVQMMNIPDGTIINLNYLTANNLSALIVDEAINTSVSFELEGLWSQSYGSYILMTLPSTKLGCQ